jgi:predicted RNA-binding Zn-ribbon protein involved in translation (DUF1610 family)
MIQCAKCNAPLPERSASICGNVFGDEYIESYFYCPNCGKYTREIYHDRFSGEDSITVQGPIDAPEAEAKIAVIRRCPAPSDEGCDCAAHREYFGI